MSRSSVPDSNSSPPTPSPTPSPLPHYQIRCPRLPLAVYREVAAHLRQVDGVEAELLPQTAPEFNYEQSQIGGIRIFCSPAMTEDNHHQIEQILTYYGDRFQSWEFIYPESSAL